MSTTNEVQFSVIENYSLVNYEAKKLTIYRLLQVLQGTINTATLDEQEKIDLDVVRIIITTSEQFSKDLDFHSIVKTLQRAIGIANISGDNTDIPLVLNGVLVPSSLFTNNQEQESPSYTAIETPVIDVNTNEPVKENVTPPIVEEPVININEPTIPLPAN